jgi:hypothetical protein
MSRTLWIAAAVDLAAVAAMLAAPSVRHLQRLDATLGIRNLVLAGYWLRPSGVLTTEHSTLDRGGNG